MNKAGWVLIAALCAIPAQAEDRVVTASDGAIIADVSAPAPEHRAWATGDSLDGVMLAQSSRRRDRYDRDRDRDRYDEEDRPRRSRRGKNRYVRRRNIAIGATALGLITGSGFLTGVGIGGIAANEFAHDSRGR